jgi:SAM-dependent methyltransferase
MSSSPAVAPPRCRLCGAPVERVFADLGMSPLANALLTGGQVRSHETFYPLRVLACDACLLVQLEEFETPSAIFSDYVYFSSYSTTWLDHARRYVEMAVERFSLDESKHVVELASNDGYLLQYLVERHIPVLGIEPAANVAKVALQKGVPTLVEFFGRDLAQELRHDSAADLIVGNNVLAHVPDVNDFVGGMKTLLKGDGAITVEFPHLLQLIAENQFDTIYHEHFSYLSLGTTQRLFAEHGLRVFDLAELPTHGGSLRIFACHDDDDRNHPTTPAVEAFRAREVEAGLDSPSTYSDYSLRVEEAKREILEFLIERKRRGWRIAGYGAPAKGNTMLNYCGVGTDFIDFTVDLSPHKQGLFLPGTHIPVLAPEAIRQARPDLVLILPWNLRDEIVEQLSFIREWGGRFAARAPVMQELA